MRARCWAFTLVEILIVVVILGIIAAVLVVNVAAAQTETKASVGLADMKRVQNAIAYFQAQQSAWPTETGSVPGVIAWDKLLQETVGPTGVRYGPYISNRPKLPSDGGVGVLDELGSFRWAAGG